VKLFPVLVEEYDLSGSSLSKFKQIIVEQGQKGFHHLAVTGESSHGRWNPFCIEESLPLGNLVVECLQDYVDKLRCRPVKIDNTWYNVLPPGGYTKRHRHEYSVVSGALYLDLPQNSGDLYFVSPLQPYRMCELHEDYSDYNAYEFDLPIKENHLYLFPSWLEHGSRVNESDQDRIMVSFNTSHYTSSS
jgi:uncharacterized protein (TIGR02466 family)